MMYINKQLNKIVNYLAKDSQYGIYLSIFRVYLALHIMQKVIFVYPNIDILFFKDSADLEHNSIVLSLLNNNIQLLIVLILLAAILVLFGIGRNLSMAILYILTEVFQQSNVYLMNGGDYLLKFLLLYMCFTDSYRYLSIKKRLTKASPYENILTNVAVLYIIGHLCLVYVVSGLFKANTKVWFSGIASYYTLLIDRFKGTRLNETLALNGWMVTLITYFVMLWEIYFPFLVYIKKTRYITLLAGVFIHIGIFIFMMIYDFEILFVACYGFFFKDSDFIKFKNKILSSKIIKKLQFFFNRTQELKSKLQ